MKKIIILICLLTILTILILTNNFILVDTFVYEKISLLNCDFLTNFLKIFTFLGNTISVIVIYLLLVIYLILTKKSFKDVILLGLISVIINFSIKNIVRKPRPNVNKLISETGFSFPSGHAQNNTVLYKNLNKTFNIKILSYVVIFLISISRVYLGVHYFSDILIGFLLGELIYSVYYYIKDNML